MGTFDRDLAGSAHMRFRRALDRGKSLLWSIATA
jgi:hypothetical protein